MGDWTSMSTGFQMDVSEFVKLASYIENLNLTSAKTVSHMSFLFNLRDSAWSCILKIKTHVHRSATWTWTHHQRKIKILFLLDDTNATCEWENTIKLHSLINQTFTWVDHFTNYGLLSKRKSVVFFYPHIPNQTLVYTSLFFPTSHADLRCSLQSLSILLVRGDHCVGVGLFSRFTSGTTLFKCMV